MLLRRRAQRRRARRLAAVAVLAGGALLAGPVRAAQTTPQWLCLHTLNLHGWYVAKEQDRANRDCVKYAGRGQGDRLGPSGSAQACLTGDVAGRIAARIARLTDRARAKCLAKPEQMPDFGFTGSGQVARSATEESLTLIEDLFGPDLDGAIFPDDPAGSRCQEELVSRSNRVFEDLWRQAVTANRNGLRGRDRYAGGPDVPVEEAPELWVEIHFRTQADPGGKIARSVGRLGEKVRDRCADTERSLAELFPGVCSAAANPGELVACAEEVARAHFYRVLARVADFGIGCDLLDDGRANDSCPSAAQQHHVLSRIGYGPDAYSALRIGQLGVRGYIEDQLDPASIADDALESMLAVYPSLTMDFQELRANYNNNDPMAMGTKGVPMRELAEAKLLRALASRRQLEQVLVDFWFDHFNVYALSGRQRYDTLPYERDAIRPRILGSFEELVLATARSPAMLDYLDNVRNTREGYVQGGIERGINENYARELMELHTVGVDGGYVENDVFEVARAFTGWQINTNNLEKYPDGFRYRDAAHDQDPKVVMGLAIPPGGGEQDGLAVIELLASHGSTAEFISRKLVVRFVSESAPSALVGRAAATFLGTRGDLREVVRTILHSPEFLLAKAYRRTKVKRPLVFFASLGRATGTEPSVVVGNLRRRIRNLGETLYGAAPPTGYPDVSQFWTSPGTLITRFNEAERKARGKDGFAVDYGVSGGTSGEIVDALIPRLHLVEVSEETRDAAVAYVDSLGSVSDAKRVEQAAAFLLSSPEFLHH